MNKNTYLCVQTFTYIAYVHVKSESMMHGECVCMCVCMYVCVCTVRVTEANKNGPAGDRSDTGGRGPGQSTPRTCTYGGREADGH